MGRAQSKKISSLIPRRRFRCPNCGAGVRIPLIWIIGVESIFPCPKCRMKFKTGYKTGAVLFALALTMAVVTVNLGAWIFSSFTIPLMVILVLPLWILYGFALRRLWMIHKAKRSLRNNR